MMTTRHKRTRYERWADHQSAEWAKQRAAASALQALGHKVEQIEQAYARTVSEPDAQAVTVVRTKPGQRVQVQFPFMEATPTLPAPATGAVNAMLAFLEQFPPSVRCGIVLHVCVQMEQTKQ